MKPQFRRRIRRRVLSGDAVMSLGEPDNEIFVRYYIFGEKIREIAKATRRKPIYRKNQAFQRKTKTERNFITCGGTVMKQKNDLFEELNINPKNRDVCSPFAVDIQAIKRNVNQTLDSCIYRKEDVIMKPKRKQHMSPLRNTGAQCNWRLPQTDWYQLVQLLFFLRGL